MKKSKVSGTWLQEAKETAGNVDSYELLPWMAPFIAACKTKSNLNLVRKKWPRTQ